MYVARALYSATNGQPHSWLLAATFSRRIDPHLLQITFASLEVPGVHSGLSSPEPRLCTLQKRDVRLKGCCSAETPRKSSPPTWLGGTAERQKQTVPDDTKRRTPLRQSSRG